MYSISSHCIARISHIDPQLSNSWIIGLAQALKETAERLEGASDESQEKLTIAFEIAGSLRKLLEDREGQFATLEGNCRVCLIESKNVYNNISTDSSLI